MAAHGATALGAIFRGGKAVEAWDSRLGRIAAPASILKSHRLFSSPHLTNCSKFA
jgi:hypothetical protein